MEPYVLAIPERGGTRLWASPPSSGGSWGLPEWGVLLNQALVQGVMITIIVLVLILVRTLIIILMLNILVITRILLIITIF